MFVKSLLWYNTRECGMRKWRDREGASNGWRKDLYRLPFTIVHFMRRKVPCFFILFFNKITFFFIMTVYFTIVHALFYIKCSFSMFRFYRPGRWLVLSFIQWLYTSISLLPPYITCHIIFRMNVDEMSKGKRSHITKYSHNLFHRPATWAPLSHLVMYNFFLFADFFLTPFFLFSPVPFALIVFALLYLVSSFPFRSHSLIVCILLFVLHYPVVVSTIEQESSG